MARNRKRAKERRARRPGGAVASRGVATSRDGHVEDGAPSPIEHAAPDVELADAQLAIGRPELGDADDLSEEAEAEELEEELEDGVGADYGEPPSGGGGSLVAAGGEPGRGGVAVAQPRVGLGGRLVGFLQGSWRELQRVQWPDRRQVAQATGVVLGFVIVAGVFLGLADLVSQKLVTFIINGK